jgi:hypothetical protein
MSEYIKEKMLEGKVKLSLLRESILRILELSLLKLFQM